MMHSSRAFRGITLLLSSLFLTTVSLADRGRPIVTPGGTIRADNGAMLRGVHHDFNNNSAGWYEDLKSRGHFNLVRAMGHLGCWHPAVNRNCTDPQTIGPLMSWLDEVVEYTANADMYLIIDNHTTCCEGYRWNLNYEFWGSIAPRYKDRTHVIYEIQNEATNGMGYAKEDVMNFEKEMYTYIRERAPNTPIITHSAANIWGDMVNGVLIPSTQGQNAIDYSNAAFGFHHYCWDQEKADLLLAIMDAGFPVIMTEGGEYCLTNFAGGTTPREKSNNQMMWLENHGCSWVLLGDANYWASVSDWPIIWDADPYYTGEPTTLSRLKSARRAGSMVKDLVDVDVFDLKGRCHVRRRSIRACEATKVIQNFPAGLHIVNPKDSRGIRRTMPSIQ